MCLFALVLDLMLACVVFTLWLGLDDSVCGLFVCLVIWLLVLSWLFLLMIFTLFIVCLN